VDDVEEFAYFWDECMGFISYTWTSSTGLASLVSDGLGGQLQIYGSASAGTWEYCYISKMCASAALQTENSWRIKLSSATDICAMAGLFDSTRANYTVVTIDTASSSNFRFATKSTGTTTVDTGIALDTNWHEFKIIMATGACSFFMDGVMYGPATTAANITANLVAPCFGIKTVVSRRYIYADWLEMFCSRAA
jgi:hypothetical protein